VAQNESIELDRAISAVKDRTRRRILLEFYVRQHLTTPVEGTRWLISAVDNF